MSNKIDEILVSGCIEKLLDSKKEISSKEELSAYLSENGFNDVSDEDLDAIITQLQALESAGGGFGVSLSTGTSTTTVNQKGNVKQSCSLNLV